MAVCVAGRWLRRAAGSPPHFHAVAVPPGAPGGIDAGRRVGLPVPARARYPVWAAPGAKMRSQGVTPRCGGPTEGQRGDRPMAASAMGVAQSGEVIWVTMARLNGAVRTPSDPRLDP